MKKILKRQTFLFPILILAGLELTHAEKADPSVLPKDSGPKEETVGMRSAKEAWEKLTRRFAKRPEFAYVENDPSLPNVLIYGDSISIGYTQRVRKNIGSKANVYRLNHNGGNSTAFIPMMTKNARYHAR